MASPAIGLLRTEVSRREHNLAVFRQPRAGEPLQAQARAPASGRLGERRTSKRNCAALETLFTFCPPGPLARMKVTTISGPR